MTKRSNHTGVARLTGDIYDAGDFFRVTLAVDPPMHGHSVVDAESDRWSNYAQCHFVSVYKAGRGAGCYKGRSSSVPLVEAMSTRDIERVMSDAGYRLVGVDADMLAPSSLSKAAGLIAFRSLSPHRIVPA